MTLIVQCHVQRLQSEANRSSPGKEFYKRLNEFKEFLGCLYPSVEKDGYEADELMYSIAVTTPGPHFIYTNDHDLLQAVSWQLGIVMLKSFHSKLFTWDEDKVKIEYGVAPALLPIYFAFIGDSVDNIVGVPRISKRYLAELITWASKMSLDTMLKEIACAEWPSKMQLIVQEFIKNGQWQKNYDLIKLKPMSYLIKHAKANDELVIAKLREWEIYTLALCKKFNLTCSEEF